VKAHASNGTLFVRATALDDNAGGGTEYQIYEQAIIIDSPNASNWIRNSGLSFSIKEYDADAILSGASSIINIPNNSMYQSQIIGIADGNQTAQKLIIFVGNNDGANLKKVGILKSSYTDNGTTVLTKEILIEKDITIGLDGFIEFSNIDFNNPTITDKETLTIYFFTDTTFDLYPCFYRLKCSID